METRLSSTGSSSCYLPLLGRFSPLPCAAAGPREEHRETQGPSPCQPPRGGAHGSDGRERSRELTNPVSKSRRLTVGISRGQTPSAECRGSTVPVPLISSSGHSLRAWPRPRRRASPPRGPAVVAGRGRRVQRIPDPQTAPLLRRE